MGDYEDWEGWREQEDERPRDAAIDRAKQAIEELLGERSREVFYGRQVEILLERRFFHWITSFALRELIGEGEIGRERVELEAGGNVWVQFVFSRGHRYRRRQISRAIGIIREFSRVAGASGSYAEVLFQLGFLKKGFELLDEGVNEYEGKVWRKSGHDLDFVIKRDGVVYGVEVKNRLDYIEKRELVLKLEMCDALGLVPLFVMRQAAKSYNHMVIERGGYALLFGTQIYPPGQEKLVERMREVLGLPAVCSREIPEGFMERFLRWHKKKAGRGEL